MDFEKIFRPNQWFVLFCGLLIVVWFSLQMVIKMRLSNEAKAIAAEIYTWNWPDLKCSSRAQMVDTKVLHKTDSDAIVEVSGRQTLSVSRMKDAIYNEVVDCKVTMTFYRQGNSWILGKVELP